MVLWLIVDWYPKHGSEKNKHQPSFSRTTVRPLICKTSPMKCTSCEFSLMYYCSLVCWITILHIGFAVALSSGCRSVSVCPSARRKLGRAWTEARVVVCGNCTVKLLKGTVVGAVGNSLSLCALRRLYLHVSPLCVKTLDGGEDLLLVPHQSHTHLA